ncbi:HlyD family type I secretion periplasmic adaptor subunit [Rhizobium sp. NLR10a]|uniref:HlyD family type I secretion periplasmic adaptor subunit n=1 Tax=unclassified Rhizobium TaxID=2613769 RepID=UPI001C832E25|nr:MULTISPECIES: HlyD family type I secretion periplasmic adaptor subunit [unclassified Rhizobium]MBX5214019.1 HlyD family type I secretion periplasmic adaptor subunit [Rhizobium sp. NLR9a]MBX5219239.1 HlyD family type I secretion periplasmic adaptor subunit [Rhizobium sp. NLR8a]MBX5274996.1 HlyD family type I secretion periplasmic adaptor subunit [Rhizobium sp. NLR13a]MBX5281195.1 HlyD family type I secretion periplasmic adaptor subunit [Rhizobium sp. NLR10a]MBX5294772.1 HlyD family type I se
MTAPFDWQDRLHLSPSSPAILGYLAITVMICTFGVWGAVAPIDGAAVAPGVVAAAGRNIQMQHLEGGILREIKVEEGDRVRKGDVLLLLDETAAKTQVNRLEKQLVALDIQIKRLEAERDGLESLIVTIKEVSSVDTDFSDIGNEEVREFEARLARFESEQLILAQRLDQLADAQEGLVQQKLAVDKQSFIIKDELARKQGLLEKGLINRTDYTELLRIDAELVGQSAALAAQQANTRSQEAEAREQIERAKSQRVEEAVSKLTEAKASLRDVEEQLTAASGVLGRTTIRAPVDGIIVTSAYNVVGNVISPGEKVMEILPTSEQPLIEARVKPTDIDVVHIGQTARLRFSALNARLTPEVTATVRKISADRLVDQASQESYYRAILQVTGSLPPSIDETQVHPGMPVETFINTGERTFFEYLLKPLLDSTRLAFVED